MAAPGSSRPRSSTDPSTSLPPNFNNSGFRGNPDTLADNLGSLNINQAPVTSNAVTRPTPFAQSSPFPTGSPISMAGPPPSMQGGPLTGAPPSALPPSASFGRPTGPPPVQGMPPFGARSGPMVSGSQASTFPSGMVNPPGGPPPSRVAAGPPPPPYAQQDARPGAFAPQPMPSNQVVPSSGFHPQMSNGPTQVASGVLPAVPRFLTAGSTTASQPSPGYQLTVGTLTHTSPHAPSMRPFSDASAIRAPPFPSKHLGMPSSAAYQVTVPPQSSPIGVPEWAMLSQQIGAPMEGALNIDPNLIPRPVPFSSVFVHETRQGNQATTPPPATSDYVVKDTGNCSPRYMRCTINQIPCTVDMLSSSGMQLALLVQPLALPHPSEEPVQVVDFREGGPVRCTRCKAYINPFMKFIDHGRQFICNLCGFAVETPCDYHCNLGPDGRRRDADERPELCRGTVEFVATKEFMVREPMPAVLFFLIDVSTNAVLTGATASACSAISQVIGDLPEVHRTLVGVATFDSTIHFYNLKHEWKKPLMFIVPDVQDVYTPLQTDVIVPLSECRQHLESLLENIPSMFQSNKTADSAFGAAIKAAFLAMKATGGKLLVFQSVLPSMGIGCLSAREAEGRTNVSAGKKEAHKYLQPMDQTYVTMANEFAEYQVCVDVFLMTQTYVDIASFSVVPRTTGGQIYYYYPFSSVSDHVKLCNDLRWNVTRPQGFEAVLRVRCSQGIEVQEYHGNFCKWVPTDVDLPAIDCDKTLMVTLKYDDKLQDKSECAFQCAVLYTTVSGERRIRVSTLSLPVTSMLKNLFDSADAETQLACFIKQAAIEIPLSPLLLVRERVTELCIDILLAYRKYCATVSSSGQLIVPEALKLLPLYTLALVKSTGLRTDAKIDERSFWINHVSSISVPLAIRLICPRMFSILDLDSREEDGSVVPSFLPLSSEQLSDGGIYLLENGLDCLIYVGCLADTAILHKLFGVPSIDEIPTLFVLQEFDNSLSRKLNEVLNKIRRESCSYLRLRLCKKGDPSGMLFLSYMIEDKSISGSSSAEFVIHVHKQIHTKLLS